MALSSQNRGSEPFGPVWRCYSAKKAVLDCSARTVRSCGELSLPALNFYSRYRRMNTKLRRVVRLYLLGTVVILFLTASLKLAAVMGGSGLPSQSDHVFWFLTRRELLGLAAALELLVMALVAFSRNPVIGLIASAWLGAIFLAYRLAPRLLGYSSESCACLGKTPQTVGLDYSDWLARAFLAYILGGAIVILATLGLCTLRSRIRRYPLRLGSKPGPTASKGAATFLLLLLAYAGGSSAYRTYALDFTASGTLMVSREQTTATNVLSRNNFVFRARGGNYSIVVTRVAAVEPAVIASEAVFDGRNTYHFRRNNTNRRVRSFFRIQNGTLVEFPLSSPGRIKNHADVIIDDGLVPPSDTVDEVLVVWLAYAGQRLYSASPNHWATGEPLVATPFLENPTMETSYERSSRPGGCIQELIHRYVASGIRQSVGPVPPSVGNRSQTRSAALGPAAFTAAHYACTGWTNTRQIAFPASFQMENYGWEMHVAPVQRFVFAGHLTNLTFGSSGDIAPRFQPRMMVTERRTNLIGRAGTFTYFSPDGSLLTRSQLLNNQDFQAHAINASGASTRLDPHRWAILLVFTVLLTLPGVFWLAYRRIIKMKESG